MNQSSKIGGDTANKQDESADGEGRLTKQSFWLCVLHVATLSSLALAKPLFDVTAQNAAFFVVRGSKPVDIVSLIVILSVFFPAVLVTIEWLAGLVNSRLRLMVHHSIIFTLVSLYGAQVIKHTKILDGVPALILVAALGICGAAAYARTMSCRRMVTFASPIIVLTPLIFVFGSQIVQILNPSAIHQSKSSTTTRISSDKKAPIVFILMDELPVISLLDKDGAIDAKRFPNFAEFAKTAYWFRNTAAADVATARAVPAILTGMYPDPRLLPNLNGHPDNLFTFLSKDYAFNVHEAATSLCPAELSSHEGENDSYLGRIGSLASDLKIVYLHVILPQSYAHYLPPIDNQWGNFAQLSAKNIPDQDTKHPGTMTRDELYDKIVSIKKGNRAEQFRNFISSIRNSGTPSLNFFHVMLPHGPFEFLPSTKRYRRRSELGLEGIQKIDDRFVGPQGLVDQYHKLHVLQLACLDRLVGELFDHLKKTGMFDDSLIILVADHGASFVANDYNRKLSTRNVADLAFVPLLIKSPHQTKGAMIDTNAETVDILPTIADVLGVKLPWVPSGTSLLAPTRSSKTVARIGGDDDKSHLFDFVRLLSDREKSLARNISIFGLNDTNSDLYWSGSKRFLMGKPVSGMKIQNGDVDIQIDQNNLFNAFDGATEFSPSFISGKVQNCSIFPASLALSVNGVIQAVTDIYKVNNNYIFSGIIPDSAFHNGTNNVECFLVNPDNPAEQILTTTNYRSKTYQLAYDKITSSDGAKYQITSNPPPGKLESVSKDGTTLRLEGWATNDSHTAPADLILVYAAGKFITYGKPTVLRPDVGKAYRNNRIIRSGFKFNLPAELIQDTGKIRIISLYDGVAAETSYAESLKLTPDFFDESISSKNYYHISGNSIALPNGATLPISSNILGSIDILAKSGKDTLVQGWSADVTHSKPADLLLVYSRNKLIALGKPNETRKDVSKAYHKRNMRSCGFRLLIAEKNDIDTKALRFVSISDDQASELKYNGIIP